MKLIKLVTLSLAAVLVFTQWSGIAHAESKAGTDADADTALLKLYEAQPVAKMLAEKAAAVLIFPNILRRAL